jgi:hypothetical protein
MVDTFAPLGVAEAALAFEDEAYYRSWIEPVAAPACGRVGAASETISPRCA